MPTILKAPLAPYPLATKSQEVIPHEVAAPAGCYRVALDSGASYVLEEMPEVPIVAIACEGPLLAVFSEGVAVPEFPQGGLVAGAMVCPPGVTTLGKPKQPNLILLNEADEAVIVYVQLLHTWNILGTAPQTTRI